VGISKLRENGQRAYPSSNLLRLTVSKRAESFGSGERLDNQEDSAAEISTPRLDLICDAITPQGFVADEHACVSLKPEKFQLPENPFAIASNPQRSLWLS
jgi:hypothetical protein